ncbi:MAG: glutamate--tRNA ligase [Psychroflexus sp.]|nr:glutamate--tRNA ligase [Psychroflexus sp.]MDR9448600.1 glutamate--tRNA ligase [Psychroflexus sp.]
MASEVRVRFAPSPTGPLHIGGLRTALYNYLFAKKHQGSFVLRIEDTDQKRYVAEAEKYIIDALTWCGIPYDEGPEKESEFGPYHQSQRTELYAQYADQLIDEGKAYYAFDTEEELEALRKEYEAKGETFKYGPLTRNELNNSLHLDDDELKTKLANESNYVIRFKTPINTQINAKDEVRGYIQVNSDELDDKILFKSDGMPTYHLANIVDDHLMKISHVIRGEEWLPSLALHVLLYEAFGWEKPVFAHLPLLLKPNGKGKLSKRDGEKLGIPVFPLEWNNAASKETFRGYREEGILPEALLNMLAMLGWNAGDDQELFTKEELIEKFSLDRVHKAGAVFDPDKVKWFQHEYFKKIPTDHLLQPYIDIVEEKGFTLDYKTARSIIEEIRERADQVKDLWEQSDFYFQAPEYYDAKAVKKIWKGDIKERLEKIRELVKQQEDFSRESIKHHIKSWIEQSDYGFGKIMQPFRLALVGEMKGPGIFHIAATIGREETLRRIDQMVEQLG